MKQTIFTHIALAMVLLAGLAACTDNMIELPATNGSDNMEVPDGYYFVLDTDAPQDAAQTRVAYQDIYHSYFEEDDRLGIYAIDESGNLVPGQPTNAEYRVINVTNVVTGNVRQVLENVDPANRIERGYRYVIYYPYIEDMTINYLKSLNYGIQLDQNTTSVTPATGVEVHNALTGYEASDLLWDVAEDKTNAAGTHYVNIEMDHAMANIVFDISEEYLSADENGEYEVNILGVSRRAQGMNLTQSSSDSWKYSTGSSTTSIRMWNSGFTSSGARQFRAAIPAYQGTNGTIAEGTPFLQIKGADGTAKQFKLKGSLTLLPGKYYHFSAIKTTIDPEGPVIPDITDDDSWVLDVLDPETGQPVGLLCREYLRYQPQIQENSYDTPDKTTGTVVDDNKSAINSQAWVFYNLQADGKTPELSKGTVLRFIYDIHENRNNVLDAAHFWPLPHTQPGDQTHQGLFTPEHGFKWIQSKTPADNGNYYGISSSEVDESLLQDNEKETNYFMHGGTIYWDGQNNKISDFTPLAKENAPTNEQAKMYGHIAINPETKEVKVSYSAISGTDYSEDANGCRIGILIPRNLIDKRGNSEPVSYPLTKIGYNQFWISKPFRATTLTDGTTLPCYNKQGNPNGNTLDERKPATVTFNTSDYIQKGYIFPFAKNVTTGDGSNTNYDPFNDPAEMAGPQGTEWDGRESSFRPAPLYNKLAVEDPNFVPKSTENEYEYLMPTADEFEAMIDYFGYGFAAKLCTREIARMVGAQTTAYGNDRYTALMRGETYNAAAGFFTANISGFNLHPTGYFSTDATDGTSVGNSAAIILKSQQNVSSTSVAYISFEPYSPWNSTPYSGFFYTAAYNYGNFYTSFFAQVRLFMRFKNPTVGGTSVSYHTRSASPQQPESLSVYVPLEAVE